MRTGDVGVVASAGWLRSDGDRFLRRRRRARRLRQSRREPEDRGAAVRRGPARRHRPLDRGRTATIDGFDPVYLPRADTLDSTENRIAAVRGWAEGRWGGWTVERRRLLSRQRQPQPPRRRAAEQHVRRPADARRPGLAAARRPPADRRRRARSRRISAPATPPSSAAPTRTAARHLTAFVGEWRAEWSDWRSSPTSPSATTASAPSPTPPPCAPRCWSGPARGLSLHAAYGEGIAQPTFYDLYGFFPGSFVGNPALTPEHVARLGGGHRLAERALQPWRDLFLGAAAGRDRRRIRSRHLPLQHRECRPARAAARGSSSAPAVASAGWLQPRGQLHLARRRRAARRRRGAGPRGAAAAAQRQSDRAMARPGRFRWGASLAYVGKRRDTDFDLFPAATVTLDDYLLASANLAYPPAAAARAVRAGGKRLRRRLSGRGRLQHAGTGRSMRAFASLLAISLALAAAARGRRAAAGGVAQPVHRRAACCCSPRRSRSSRSPISPSSRRRRRCGGRRGATRATTAACSRSRRCGPIWS